MAKSKILALIPQNLVIYHTKNLCHYIEHTLFYFTRGNLKEKNYHLRLFSSCKGHLLLKIT